MTHFRSVFFLLCLFIANSIFSQEQTSSIPSVRLKDVKGKSYNTSDLAYNNGKAVIICFVKTCCASPTSMLDNIAEVYEEWQENTGVVLYVISTDDARSTCKVAPLANVKEWEYQIFLDPNSDFKRKMSVVVNPHTFVLDGKGEIIWQKAGYSEGDENEIIKLIEKL